MIIDILFARSVRVRPPVSAAGGPLIALRDGCRVDDIALDTRFRQHRLRA
jgi:hypothetical protein